jgi:DNA-binding winged helix-turn-helix (wHTH) protein
MACFRFDPFLLDADNRQLRRGTALVDLNGRYFDALTLLVSEPGKLISKDRFLDEVWRGVPVTDEALTQCIKTLRRQLGDDASRPCFIETVPKHGYRFIAPVTAADAEPARLTRSSPAASPHHSKWRRHLLLAAGGTVGGGVAGLIGGLFYGFAATSQPLQPGMGAMSVLLVLVCLTILLALIGGAGVALGIAAAGMASRPFGPWSIAGGALGGAAVGAITKLLGLDAFNLLLGQSPGDITGGPEGALLGGAVGLGAWLGCRGTGSLRKAAGAATGLGAAAGILIVLVGGRLMGGSLDLLGRSVSGSRMRLDQLGAVVGEAGFGPVSQMVTAALEGALFAGCVVAAMILARRTFASQAGETALW